MFSPSAVSHFNQPYSATTEQQADTLLTAELLTADPAAEK